MNINIKKIIIYVCLFFILFEETINSFINISALNYIDELLIVIAFLNSLFHSIRTKKINAVTLKLILLTFTFSIVGIFSCLINSSFILKNVIYSNFLAIKFWIMVIALSNFEYNENFYNKIFDAITFYAFFNIIIGVVNIVLPNFYFSIFPNSEKSIRYGFTAICGLFNHPGKYGWFMLSASIINYVKYTKYNNKKDLFRTIIFVVFAALSFRTKVIISCVVLICYEVFLKKMSKLNIKKVLIAICGIVILFLIFKNLIVNTYNLYFTNTIAESARQVLMTNGIKIMRDYFPLGVGFGQYGSWYARIHYSLYYWQYKMTGIYGLYPNNPMFATDTFWPMIFGETGCLGTIIYIYMLVYLYKTLQKKAIQSNSISHVGILMLLQTTCESFGEPSFTSSPQCIVVAIIIGIGISSLKNQKTGESNE